jgi:hypothetical protein
MPSSFEDLVRLLQSAFDVVDDKVVATDLAAFATELYTIAFDERLKDRTAEDNRNEHEIVVLRNTVRICWRSGRERASGRPFDRQELRVAVATALLHDLRFIPRVTEEMVIDLERSGDFAGAEAVRKRRAEQRRDHMLGSAEDAGKIIARHPTLLTEAEARQCLGYIGLHDLWKLGWPYPVSSDWLAVCCVEGDALWPLDGDFGARADLERKGNFAPSFEELRSQAASNFDTQLRAYRRSFDSTKEEFQDDETIFRTTEGGRILRELRSFWDI